MAFNAAEFCAIAAATWPLTAALALALAWPRLALKALAALAATDSALAFAESALNAAAFAAIALNAFASPPRALIALASLPRAWNAWAWPDIADTAAGLAAA